VQRSAAQRSEKAQAQAQMEKHSAVQRSVAIKTQVQTLYLGGIV